MLVRFRRGSVEFRERDTSVVERYDAVTRIQHLTSHQSANALAHQLSIAHLAPVHRSIGCTPSHPDYAA